MRLSARDPKRPNTAKPPKRWESTLDAFKLTQASLIQAVYLWGHSRLRNMRYVPENHCIRIGLKAHHIVERPPNGTTRFRGYWICTRCGWSESYPVPTR